MNTMNRIQTLPIATRPVVAVLAVVAAIAAWLALAAPARAGGTVVNCSNDAELTTALAGGGVVTFNCGGAGNPATIVITATKTITMETHLDGGGLITFTSSNQRLFTVNSGAAFVVSNTIMSGGTLTNAGNGLYMLNNGTASLFSVTLRNGAVLQSSGAGGAIRNDGVLTLTLSTLSGNTIAGGGAKGAALHNAGTAWLINSTVSGNSSGNGGGAGMSNSGSMYFLGSTLNGNSTGNGEGAGLQNTGNVTLINSTVSGNSVGNSAGAGLWNSGRMWLTSTTVVSNAGGSGAGGGIFNSTGALSVTAFNSIVANNTASSGSNCSGGVTSLGYNLSNNATCAFTATGDVINTVTELGPLQNNGGGTATHKPAPGSAAVDAGACALPTDQRGLPRPAAVTLFCDVGAVEAEGAAADLSISKTAAPASALPGRSVTYTISFSNTGSGKAGGVVITDVLPPALVSLTVQTSIAPGYGITALVSGPTTYVWTVGDMRPGVGGRITFTALVSPSLAANMLLTNTVHLTGTGDVTPANNLAAAVISAELAPNIAVSKAVTPSHALPGQSVTYTLRVANTGFALATSARLTDVVPASLTSVIVQSSAPITPTAGVTYTWQLPNLAPNAAMWITLTGVVSPNLRGDANFTNTATASAAGDIFPADDASAVNLGASSCFARVYDGVSDGPLFLTVQGALNTAQPGQLVKVAGVCVGSAVFTTSLTLRGGYTLTGWSASNPSANPAVLDAVQSARTVNTGSGHAIALEDITLTGGRVSGGNGGGVLNIGSVVTLTRVTVQNNVARDFGGHGGGIANLGTMRIDSSVVASNLVTASSSGRGGGVYNAGALYLLNTTVISNSNTSSGGRGGGLANGGALAVERSAFVANQNGESSNLGGGLWNSATAALTNTTFSGNIAYDFSAKGGGAANVGGALSLVNVTFSGNQVFDFASSGGGLYRSGGTLSLANTIVANSVGGACDGVVASSGYNLIDDASCGIAATGDITNTPAVLGPLESPVVGAPFHRPLPFSPARDNGGAANCPATDQRGVARPQGAACDIGAVEIAIPARAFLPATTRGAVTAW